MTGVEFDAFTVSLLALRDDAPEWDEETASAMQDAHLDHLAKLHEQGHLMAAGPLGHDRFRGLSILRVPPDEARALKEADPAVQAGRFDVVVAPWQVPAGAVQLHPHPLPALDRRRRRGMSQEARSAFWAVARHTSSHGVGARPYCSSMSEESST